MAGFNGLRWQHHSLLMLNLTGMEASLGVFRFAIIKILAQPIAVDPTAQRAAFHFGTWVVLKSPLDRPSPLFADVVRTYMQDLLDKLSTVAQVR